MLHVPSRMTAIEITSPGGPEVLRAVERPVPQPGPGEVLVRVEAAGVNRPDIMQRLGKYPPPPGASDIPGLEIAGTIVQVGGESATGAPGVSRWQPGDTVCALVAGGGYAEYCAVPAPQCLPIPDGMAMISAAAIPETFFTVWTNLFQRGALRAGERVLVHGGTSGIGTTAIQLAHAAGAMVLATAGSDHKCEACRRLGAAVAINYRTADFVEVVRREAPGGVDVILDIVGGDYFARNLECLALNGRLVQVGVIGGSRGQIDLAAVLRKRLTVTGSTLRVRSVAEKGAIAGELEEHVWPMVADGRVAPVIDRTFPLTDAAGAHRRLESGDQVGKVVLICGAGTL
ncbi:MAG: NAD(P)H-quinone oxidoreductase [Acidobacteriota bacterium]